MFLFSCKMFAVSMIMFSSFENSVDFLYRRILQMQKSDCSKGTQLGVTCIAGYMAGTIGTLVSNPADNVVSSLYNNRAQSLLQVVYNLNFVSFCNTVFNETTT